MIELLLTVQSFTQMTLYTKKYFTQSNKYQCNNKYIDFSQLLPCFIIAALPIEIRFQAYRNAL
jgi:hypothetical protein